MRRVLNSALVCHSRPDITEVVDWVYNVKLLTYLSQSFTLDMPD